jgi:hypothetical protein
MRWTYHQHGLRLVFADAYFLCHKHILATNIVAKRQRNGSQVPSKKPEVSGRPRSIKRWRRLKAKQQKVPQIKNQLPKEI